MTLGMEERVPDLERVVIENCGHWTQQERPVETSAAMLALPPPPAAAWHLSELTTLPYARRLPALREPDVSRG